MTRFFTRCAGRSPAAKRRTARKKAAGNEPAAFRAKFAALPIAYEVSCRARAWKCPILEGIRPVITGSPASAAKWADFGCICSISEFSGNFRLIIFYVNTCFQEAQQVTKKTL